MSMIYVPNRNIMDAELSELKLGLEGWFTLRAIRKSGRVTREISFKADMERSVGPFHNLITTLGLDRFGSLQADQVYKYAHVGTGTATPAFTDTTLATWLGVVNTGDPTSTSTGNSGAPDYYSYRRLVYTSAVGQLGNNTLTEVGISGQTTTGNLFSRELIRDIGGSPVSFPILSDEQLEVTYELRNYPPLTDNAATITISGVSFDTITRAISVSDASAWAPASWAGGNNPSLHSSPSVNVAYTGNLVSVTGSAPSGSLGGASSITTAAYSNGNFYRDNAAIWNAASGVGSIRTVVFKWWMARFQVQFDPVIVKTNIQTLTLNQRISWARR